MRLKKRQISGRESGEEAVKLLEQLRDKLYSDHVGIARRAAFNLSWMQEDGLEILKEVLFSEASKRIKGAAAYGLRKMRGRMKKPALELLSQGVKDSDSATAEVCVNALSVTSKSQAARKPASAQKTVKSRFAIREVQGRAKQRRVREKVRRYPNHFRR